MTHTDLDALKALIRKLLPSGYVTVDKSAQQLGISVRSLQRHLHEAGVSHSQLVDEVRFEIACRLLDEREMSIADVGRALGFTDPSNFSRAFMRWTGMSPTTCQHRPRGTEMRLPHSGVK